ncbi:major capsid protein [Nostoc sp. NIES-2111]
MAVTILEYAKLNNNPLAQGIVEVFASVNPVLQVMPFINIQGNAYSYNREGTLPGIAFRGINEAYTESTGVINPQTETLSIIGGDSDIDVALVKMGVGSADIRAAHDAMKAKAASLSWLFNFFNGNNQADPRVFDGLQRRLIGSQLIDAGATSGGDVLTLDMIDRLLDAVEGQPSALFMSRTLRRKVNALMRAAGAAIETVSDVFGRQVQAYAGVPILTAPTDAALGSYGPLFPFTEANPGGGAAASASIYAVRFDPADGVVGIQTGPMEVRDLGEQQAKPVYRTRTEWYSGFAVLHPRAAARLRGVKNA